MDLYDTLTDAAEKADREGLSLTASKLYEALSALNTEKTMSTLVTNIVTGEEYYAKATDPVHALRIAHSDLCQCEESTFIFTQHSIGFCSFYVTVKDTICMGKGLWDRAKILDTI